MSDKTVGLDRNTANLFFGALFDAAERYARNNPQPEPEPEPDLDTWLLFMEVK